MRFPGRSWWQRLRHGRGFGVHSPSAYRYIREVLCERYSYYAYEQIDAVADSLPGGRSRARMLLRVAIHARQADIAVTGSPDVVRRVVAYACPSACMHETITPQSRLIVAYGDSFDVDAAMCCADAGATIVMPDVAHSSCASELLRRLRSELRTGHTFINGKGVAVFVPSSAPAQSFSVRF